MLYISKELQINQEIRAKEVRLIGDDGEQLGIIPLKDAIQMATEKSFDLVNISPNSVPPVCKIMDYGKHRFDQAKREKEAKKKQKTVDLKEVRLSLSIDTHDFDTKVGHATRFLKAGDKVKVSIRFKGREMGHADQGYKIMERFANAVEDYAVVEKPAKREGRGMQLHLAPITK